MTRYFSYIFFLSCLAALRAAGVWCPRALPSRDGALIAFAPLPLASGVVRNHAIRCLPFKPAGLMGGVVATTGLLRDVGVITAKVSKALASFEHPAAHRPFMWDLAQAADGANTNDDKVVSVHYLYYSSKTLNRSREATIRDISHIKCALKYACDHKFHFQTFIRNKEIFWRSRLVLKSVQFEIAFIEET